MHVAHGQAKLIPHHELRARGRGTQQNHRDQYETLHNISLPTGGAPNVHAPAVRRYYFAVFTPSSAGDVSRCDWIYENLSTRRSRRP
jgi:hypothetical protein